jgi:hypothetical protein
MSEHCEGRSHRIKRGLQRRRDELVDGCVLVPVEPFRERYLELRQRNEITATSLCLRMGWIYRPGAGSCEKERRRPGTVKADTSRALVTLGLRRRSGCEGARQFVTYDDAIKLADALGLDPWEAGI